MPAPKKRAASQKTDRGGVKAPVLLVPIDFSPDSERALDYASLLLKFLGGTLHLVHVHDLDFSYAAPGVAAMPPLVSNDEIARHYRGRLRTLAAKFGAKGEVHTHVKVGRAFDQICQLAGTIGAEIIVIATHGRTGLKRMFLGSTAERVVQHAPCAVLVVRAHAPKGAKETAARRMKILVPLDFSKCAQIGLEYAIDFAGKWKADLILLHSVQVQPIITPEHVAAYERTPSLGVIERAARAQMRRVTSKTDFGDVAHKTTIAVGHPAQQICQYAEDHGADLIITATHGHTGFAHVLIGSVAEHVVRHALCPVLVVPARAAHQVSEVVTTSSSKWTPRRRAPRW